MNNSSLDFEPNISCHEWQENDYILLCSDGLTDTLDDEDIKQIVTSQDNSQYSTEELKSSDITCGDSQNVNHACIELVKQENEKGGRDNTTVILVKIKEYKNEKK